VVIALFFSLALCRGVELVTPTTLPRLSHQGFSLVKRNLLQSPTQSQSRQKALDNEIRIVFFLAVFAMPDTNIPEFGKILQEVFEG